jgi:hypothetical protein
VWQHHAGKTQADRGPSPYSAIIFRSQSPPFAVSRKRGGATQNFPDAALALIHQAAHGTRDTGHGPWTIIQPSDTVLIAISPSFHKTRVHSPRCGTPPACLLIHDEIGIVSTVIYRLLSRRWARPYRPNRISKRSYQGNTSSARLLAPEQDMRPRTRAKPNWCFRT